MCLLRQTRGKARYAAHTNAGKPLATKIHTTRNKGTACSRDGGSDEERVIHSLNYNTPTGIYFKDPLTYAVVQSTVLQQGHGTSQNLSPRATTIVTE